MTIKQFEQLIDKLEDKGEDIYVEWLKENREMISYRAWKKRVLVNAVYEIEFDVRGGEKENAN